MGSDNPVSWARGKRDKIEDLSAPDFVRHLEPARDVCLPGVPLAAIAGFAMNGDPYNTTGWKAGTQEERDAAVAKGRFPFKKKDPSDPKVYGHIASDDLHELGWFGTEGGHCPTPCATDPRCPWVRLSSSAEVRKILGRDGVTGPAWYGAIADQCAIGCANLRRHWRDARSDLHEVLRWREDDKRANLWRWALAMMHWSAGGRACDHVNAYARDLVAVDESRRWGRFMQLAAAEDDGGNRHRQDEYSAIRTAQKIEGAVLAASSFSERWAGDWLRDDGLSDAERAAVYERLVEACG